MILIKASKQRRINNFLCILFSLFSIAPHIYANDHNSVRQELSLAEQRKFDYFFYEGLKLKNAYKHDGAFDMFKHCLKIDSTSSAALFELSSFYIQMNQPENAVNLLKKTIIYSPANQEYRNTLASLLFNLGMFGEAAEQYEILAEKHPDRPELNYYLAESYTRMGEIGKAIDTYDALENLIGMNESISMQKYQLYMTLQQQENAFNEIKKLADKFPMESRYAIILGDLYLQANNTTQALTYYNKAREIDPESPFYPISMANYYEKTGQSDLAKQQINEALINERLDVDTKISILTRYIIQQQRINHDKDGINALFQTLIDQHPEESRLKLAYGDFLSVQKKLTKLLFNIN